MSIAPARRKRFLPAVALAAAALVLSACSSGTPAAPETTAPATSESPTSVSYGDITVQLSWIKNEEFAGEFFALENGYFDEAGFGTVNLVPGPSTGVAELLSGAVDIALSDAASIGSAVAAEGAPLKLIGATFQKNPFTVLSLAEGGNIATPADLKGKKIGVQDSNTALFKALLAANGIAETELEIVPVQYDPAPLTNGEVDGFISYITNEAITVAMEGHAVTLLNFADNGLPFVAETFSVTDETLETKRDLLKAFLLAEIKGWTDFVNDPAEGARLAVEKYGADLNLDAAKTEAGALAQLDLIVTDETDANGLFTVSDALIAETITSLAGAGITLTADDLFDLSILEEIYAENPELVAYKK